MTKKKTPGTWTPPFVENRPEGTRPHFDDSMERRLAMPRKMMGGLIGAVAGDALGVPVEFKTRAEVRRDPVKGMRGYGTHSMPAGTWSDDSSLMICTVDSLINGYDLADMAARFVRWKAEGLWTPYGHAFDIGNSTADAIRRLRGGAAPELAGGASEKDNGNGSLMRILPAAMYFVKHGTEEFIERVHAISSITHRHPRSLIACGIYCLVARALINGKNADEAYREASDLARVVYDREPYRREMQIYTRVIDGNIASLNENEIKSGGYVIETLEASLWCLLTSDSYEEAVLKAVNLGDDTDTTGCVTGGLAGILYAYAGIPAEWVRSLTHIDEIDKLFDTFVSGIEMKD